MASPAVMRLRAEASWGKAGGVVHVQGVFKRMQPSTATTRPITITGTRPNLLMRAPLLLSLRAAALIGATLIGLAGPAFALRGPNDVRDMVRAGEIMPFEVIQRRVIQENQGEYVGAQFDQSTRIYRFRFLRDGSLINVDVDARTGERVRRRQSF
jgi:hypothetical protein